MRIAKGWVRVLIVGYIINRYCFRHILGVIYFFFISLEMRFFTFISLIIVIVILKINIGENRRKRSTMDNPETKLVFTRLTISEMKFIQIKKKVKMHRNVTSKV